jgi:hypothetical protein
MKREELIEDYLVYTDEGIERVHWCNVNGVKELVSPKGKVYGYVPDYFEIKRLRERLSDADKTIDYYDKKDFHYTLADGTVMGAEPAHKYKIKWGVK